MKLHDLRPAAGSRRARTRVGRGIAAGQGKTAGRGTKGQKARTGASIPAWFEGGQTPIHIRVPKLRGFKNLLKVEYAVVNVGDISAYAEAGRFGVELDGPAPKSAKGKSTDQPPVTINPEVLAQAGLIRGDSRPVKVLGQGEVGAKLFVAADAFSASARQKIEAAGGFVQVLAPGLPEADESAAPAKAAPGKTAPEKTVPQKAARKKATKAPAPAMDTAAESAVAEPEMVAEAEISIEPEMAAEPDMAAEPESTTEPTETAEQGADAAPKPRKRSTAKKGGDEA